MSSSVSQLAQMPEHLAKAVEATRETVEKRMERPEEQAPKDNPRAQESYTFDFEWKKGTHHLKGTFTNRILSLKQWQLVGNLQAVWQAGQPYGSIDPTTRELNLMLAHLSFSLEAKPKWAENLQDACYSIEMLQALYEEVASHEATFHGHPTFEKDSGEDGQ